jgi:TorA maturation chaperone TorD
MEVEIHRAAIYDGLAQALVPPGFDLPDWITKNGREWPLFDAAVRLAAKNSSSRWRQAIEALTEVTAGSLMSRCSEYETLFVGTGQPPIWLYECYHVDGKIPGPSTFAVKSLYERVGLKNEGAELADHAAFELYFLAFLCERGVQAGNTSSEWEFARQYFIKHHARRWLPSVGRSLIQSGYSAWAAIGHLLIASLEKEKVLRLTNPVNKGIPQIANSDECSLCGFCVQVCPTKALRIRENNQTTELWVLPEYCISCRKCEQVCDRNLLSVYQSKPTEPVMLRGSLRATCPACGTQTVSQAEIAFITDQLGGHPVWLDFCLDCRHQLIEMRP